MPEEHLNRFQEDVLSFLGNSALNVLTQTRGHPGVIFPTSVTLNAFIDILEVFFNLKSNRHSSLA